MIHIKKADEPVLPGEYTVTEKDGYRYYFGVNEYYVDTLNATVTDKFIEEIYVEYREGFFDAVTLARTLAREGDCVLLSPASASFDAFKNFAQRGNTFKKIVMEF